MEPLLEIEATRWGAYYQETQYSPKSREWEEQKSWLFTTFFPKRGPDLLKDFKDDGVYPSIDPPEFSYKLSVKEDLSGTALLSLQNPNERGVIYYTLDQSDPRKAYSGQVNGQLLSGEIKLTEPCLVKARVKTKVEWSVLQQIEISW